MQIRLFPLGAVIFLGMLVGVGATGAANAECLASNRQVKSTDGSVALKTYSCSLTGASAPALTIEIDRLNEAAAGSLVEATPYPDLARTFGNWKVVRTPVFAEAKKLFDTYGTNELTSSCFVMSAGPVGSKAHPKGDGVCNEKRSIWYLMSFPDRENLTTKDIALPEDQRIFLTTNGWPKGWNFFYSECKTGSLIPCTILWRPAQSSDLVALMQDRPESADPFDTPEEIAKMTPEMQAIAKQDQAELAKSRAELKAAQQKFVDLVKYLNADAWHPDLLTVTAIEAGCGESFDFAIHVRQLELETAFVKNISNVPLSLGGVNGIIDTVTSLRPDTKAAGGASVVPFASAIVLKPGETAAIPLKISFVPAGGAGSVFQDALDQTPVDRAAADRTYKRIQAAAPRTVFTASSDDPNPKVIKKIRESFGPPSTTSLPDLAFGPAIDLKGLVIDGKTVELAAPTHNFFQIAAGEGYGSCPYVYSYDDKAEQWVWHGKIIHNANSPAKEMTERLVLSGLVTRFSIREEELEVSYIRHVALDLTLAGGRIVTLQPRGIALNGAEPTRVIQAGEGRDVAFDVPSDIHAAEVTQSTLAVTGYYLRYSTLAARGAINASALP